MNDPLIRLSKVDFRYDGQHLVLSQCDFELYSGQRVAIIGANGSGKTTLLHLIVGLLRPAAGSIEAFGRTRHSEADFREVRRRVGLLFQDPDDQLFCPTVAEDVAFGPLNLGKSRHEVVQIVQQTLAELGLAGYERRVTYKLSGGEKRLVSLATVLAMQPEVLLLDEPTAGLDEQSTENLQRLLAKLPQAMVLVSHQRDFIARTASSVLKLQNGRLHPVGA
jgi:cobalt/nickel transport system ATP-binding protein